MNEHCASLFFSRKRLAPFTLIILDTTTSLPSFLPQLLYHKPTIICADGASDLLFHFKFSSSATRPIPHFIVGDLDSITTKTLQYYREQGTEIIHDTDENRCDFAKALDVAACGERKKRYEGVLEDLVVIGGIGKNMDRFDQTIGNINRFYCAAQRKITMYWLGEGGWVTVLVQGEHRIKVDASQEGPMCALLPIGNAVGMVKTSGLKWNVHGGMSFGFGGLISTSNQIAEPVVEIDTSHPLLWWCQLRDGPTRDD